MCILTFDFFVEEQHQQLLRQQQLQRQQEQRVTAQQISPSTQHRSTAGFTGGQQHQQVSPNQQERQRRDEQGFFSFTISIFFY